MRQKTVSLYLEISNKKTHEAPIHYFTESVDYKPHQHATYLPREDFLRSLSINANTCVNATSSLPFSFVSHVKVKAEKIFSYENKQSHLIFRFVDNKLSCTSWSNYIGQVRLNLTTRISEHKFSQRFEVCKDLSSNPTHRFNFKQPEILQRIAIQKKLILLESTYLAIANLYDNFRQNLDRNLHLGPFSIAWYSTNAFNLHLYFSVLLMCSLTFLVMTSG